MKIATYKDGSRDGQLVVVSRDLTLAHYATAIVGRMQQLLDDWNFLSPQLDELSQTLNHGKARHAFAFDPASCMAPLPRGHCIVMADPPLADPGRQMPAVAVVRGDAPLGARDPMPMPVRDAGGAGDAAPPVTLERDLCGQLALITGDLAADAAADDALAAIRLLALAGSWHPIDGDQPPRAEPWGRIAFAPVAVTPDELGAAWSGGSIDLVLEWQRDGRRVGRHPTAGDAGWPIGELLAACARHGPLRAGSIVCSGLPAGDAARMRGLRAGEALRLEAIGRDGGSVFGSIEPTSAGQR